MNVSEILHVLIANAIKISVSITKWSLKVDVGDRQ